MGDIITHSIDPDIPRLMGDIKLDYSPRDISVALIGFGKMGLLHSTILNLLYPNSVKYIVDRDFTIRLGGRLFLRDIWFLKNIEELINSRGEIDSVYVTTPTSSHYYVVKRLVESGFKYIFVEKPPTLNIDELLDLIDISKQNKITIGLQKRFSPLFRHAKSIIDRNILGDIESIECFIKSSDVLEKTNRYRQLGRGVLLDLGIHVLDLLCWLLGGEFTVEYAYYKTIHSGVDDYFKAKLEIRDVKVDFETTWSDPTYRLPETHLEFRGSSGVLHVTDDYVKITLYENQKPVEKTFYKPIYYRGFPPVLVADPEYTIEDIDFINRVIHDDEPLVDLEKSICSMEIAEELYRVVDIGRRAITRR